MKIRDHVLDLASLQELVDSLPALIHTGRPDGYLDFFNRHWLDFVGLRLEDLEGWKWTAAIHPDDVTALVTNWRACLESGRPLDRSARQKSGRCIPLDVASEAAVEKRGEADRQMVRLQRRYR